MILDTRVLIDFFDGKEEAVEIIRDRDDLKIPPAVLYELYAGGGNLKEIEKIRKSFPRIHLTAADEVEAAEIRRSREAAGEPIGSVDYLIAASARNRDEAVATADSHFERIDGLELETY